MSNDATDNPFRKLAEQLAKRGKKSRQGAAASRPSSGTAKKELRNEVDDDAALFMDAVARIKPLKGKGGTGGPGESLAARLKANQGGALPGPAADPGPAFKTSPSVSLSPAQPRQAGAAAPVPGSTSSDAPLAGQPGPHLAANPFSCPSPQADLVRTGANAASSAADAAREEELFARAVQGVRALNGRGRALVPGTEPRPAAPGRDPAALLREILEGRVEFALHHTDEYQEGYVVGLDPLVLARLRAGRYSPEKHLDLHGLNARQAHDALAHFIKNAYQRNMRCVVVVTGRGRNSPDGVGVLRPLLQNWLSREPFKRVVLAFCTAKAGDGGPGALYVLLRKYKKSRGKIVWERTPADDDFPDA